MSASRRPDVVRAAGRGAVAAMAMTGLRSFTKGAGLVRADPPERVARQGVPHLLARVPPERRDAAIELAHWAFGACAGGVYGALPRALRARRASGPLYGLAIWLAFEAVAAPALLGVAAASARSGAERVALAADHVLYGVVLGARRPGR